MCERAGLSGHLELVCDLDATGRTRLRHQSFRVPVHLSKPFHDGGALVLNVVNPTAGFLDGDRLRSEIRVERGARLLLTTPSASRVHTMRGGRAEVSQRLEVAAGGSLEVWPEWLIPQRGARYRQETALILEPGAELLFFETLAPGRVASGEVFRFDELIWATDLRLAGRMIARERYRLSPHDASLTALRRRFPQGYYASAFLVSPALTTRAVVWETLTALQSESAWIGVSNLAETAFVLKLIAADSLSFRRTLSAIRKLVYGALGRPAPDLRRAGEMSD